MKQWFTTLVPRAVSAIKNYFAERRRILEELEREEERNRRKLKVKLKLKNQYMYNDPFDNDYR